MNVCIESSLAAAAKSPQSCPTLCDPIDGSPPGCPVPGILQARTLEWVAISFSSAWKWKVKVKSHSRVRLLAAPWTAAYQAPLSMGFSRQKYWSGVPLPSPMLILGPVNETPPTCETSFSLSGYCLNSENAIEPEEHGASRWKGPGSLNGCMKHRTPSYLLPTCIGLWQKGEIALTVLIHSDLGMHGYNG